jgi:hypothetical protein
MPLSCPHKLVRLRFSRGWVGVTLHGADERGAKGKFARSNKRVQSDLPALAIAWRTMDNGRG